MLIVAHLVQTRPNFGGGVGAHIKAMDGDRYEELFVDLDNCRIVFWASLRTGMSRDPVLPYTRESSTIPCVQTSNVPICNGMRTVISGAGV